MTVVVDTSAVLALIFMEPGHERVAKSIRGAAISALNLQEVYKSLFHKGVSPVDAQALIARMRLDIHVHDEGAALAAALLEPVTRRYGSGLGDRTCMALGIRLGLPVLTADRDWAQVDAEGLNVELIR